MPIKYFQGLPEAKEELLRQYSKRHYPRLGARIVYGDRLYICVHDKSCICGKCPKLGTEDNLIY